MNKGSAAALAAGVVLTAILPHIPYVRALSRPLIWFSTLAHECGHGITALLVGGGWRSIVIHADAGGYAPVSYSGRVAGALVAAGGLVGPAVVAAICFVLARSARGSRAALALGALLLLLVLVTKAGSLFTAAFVGCCAVAFGLFAVYLGDEAARLGVSFLGVQLAATVFSRSDYLFTRVVNVTGSPQSSDVQAMADALWLPYWFWGIVCGLVSVGVLAVGLWAAIAEAPSAPG